MQTFPTFTPTNSLSVFFHSPLLSHSLPYPTPWQPHQLLETPAAWMPYTFSHVLTRLPCSCSCSHRLTRAHTSVLPRPPPAIAAASCLLQQTVFKFLLPEKFYLCFLSIQVQTSCGRRSSKAKLCAGQTHHAVTAAAKAASHAHNSMSTRQNVSICLFIYLSLLIHNHASIDKCVSILRYDKHVTFLQAKLSTSALS